MDESPAGGHVSVLGLEGGVVRLVPYTSVWSELYEQEAQAIRQAIGHHIVDIQHVGSTAIPGMVAKPILDIAIGLARFEDGALCVEPMAALGYEYRGEQGIPGRHYFVKGTPRTHHVHMLVVTSQEWRELLLFRDFLRANQAAAEEYARLKTELAVRWRNDRERYTDEKTAFVKRIVALASQAAQG